MALQNRVDPFGRLVATSARGLLMGNRGGRIHADDRTLGRRRFASQAWICCVLRFKERRRAVWGRGYTELFFLDEVTALAAGHRPCFECRRADAIAYRDAAFPDGGGRAGDLDRALRRERMGPRPALARADLALLPEGAMVAAGGRAFALFDGALRGWSFEGYGPPERTPDGPFALLTPPTSVSALRHGYRARRHPSSTQARDAPP